MAPLQLYGPYGDSERPTLAPVLTTRPVFARCLYIRLLPVVLGHDQEDEEEAESNSPYLLRSGVDGNPQALPSTGRRRLLTDESEASEAVAARSAGEGGGGGAAVEVETSQTVVSLASDVEEDVGDGEVVAFTRRVSRALVVDPHVSLHLAGRNLT